MAMHRPTIATKPEPDVWGITDLRGIMARYPRPEVEHLVREIWRLQVMVSYAHGLARNVQSYHRANMDKTLLMLLQGLERVLYDKRDPAAYMPSIDDVAKLDALIRERHPDWTGTIG